MSQSTQVKQNVNQYKYFDKILTNKVQLMISEFNEHKDEYADNINDVDKHKCFDLMIDKLKLRLKNDGERYNYLQYLLRQPYLLYLTDSHMEEIIKVMANDEYSIWVYENMHKFYQLNSKLKQLFHNGRCFVPWLDNITQSEFDIFINSSIIYKHIAFINKATKQEEGFYPNALEFAIDYLATYTNKHKVKVTEYQVSQLLYYARNKNSFVWTLGELDYFCTLLDKYNFKVPSDFFFTIIKNDHIVTTHLSDPAHINTVNEEKYVRQIMNHTTDNFNNLYNKNNFYAALPKSGNLHSMWLFLYPFIVDYEPIEDIMFYMESKHKIPLINMFLRRGYLTMDKFLFDLAIIYNIVPIINMFDEKKIFINLEQYQYDLMTIFGDVNMAQFMFDNKFTINKRAIQLHLDIHLLNKIKRLAIYVDDKIEEELANAQIYQSFDDNKNISVSLPIDVKNIVYATTIYNNIISKELANTSSIKYEENLKTLMNLHIDLKKLSVVEIFLDLKYALLYNIPLTKSYLMVLLKFRNTQGILRCIYLSKYYPTLNKLNLDLKLLNDMHIINSISNTSDRRWMIDNVHELIDDKKIVF